MKNYDRALIIDADPEFCYLLKSELSQIIPDIECAGTKVAAQELFSRFHPDIVFIDTNWPDAQWKELIKLIKHGSSPLIVFLTAAVKALGGLVVEYRTEEYLEKRITSALELSGAHAKAKTGILHWLGNILRRGWRRNLARFLSIAKRNSL